MIIVGRWCGRARWDENRDVGGGNHGEELEEDGREDAPRLAVSGGRVGSKQYLKEPRRR